MILVAAVVIILWYKRDKIYISCNNSENSNPPSNFSLYYWTYKVGKRSKKKIFPLLWFMGLLILVLSKYVLSVEARKSSTILRRDAVIQKVCI